MQRIIDMTCPICGSNIVDWDLERLYYCSECGAKWQVDGNIITLEGEVE